MPSRAVLVPALLGLIILAALTPSVLGTDEQSSGPSAPILGSIHLKMPVPEVINLTLRATLYEITASWSVKDWYSFPNVRFRVTTAGFNQIVSQNSTTITRLACNANYSVKVSPIDAAGADYGVSKNAAIITKGVPELAAVALRATINSITAWWAVKDPNCFTYLRYRITTAGVDGITSRSACIINGLVCNTRYVVQVSPIDTDGSFYGVARSATVITIGVPELVDLTLQATLNVITASWSVKDPKCFSNARFHITSAGVDTLVQKYSYNITVPSCDTKYVVKVSPVDLAGADSGTFKFASTTTFGVQVNLIPMVAESLVVKWTTVQGFCKTYSSYQVTLSLLDGTLVSQKVSQQKHLVFEGLSASTTYQVRVQGLDSGGRSTSRPTTAQGTTLARTSAGGRCPYPTLALVAWSSYVVCAGVFKPAPSTNWKANTVCYYKYPPTTEVPYNANLYLVGSGWAPYGNLQEYLRMFDYTEELLVNGYYQSGSWVWGFGKDYTSTFPMDSSLLVGLPAGGDGPNDYTMLYADPAKDYRLSAAKDGHAFGGMVCAFPLKM